VGVAAGWAVKGEGDEGLVFPNGERLVAVALPNPVDCPDVEGRNGDCGADGSVFKGVGDVGAVPNPGAADFSKGVGAAFPKAAGRDAAGRSGFSTPYLQMDSQK
jgi:hypothetical protein